MANWSESMTQYFEYYIVDPNTWKDSKILDNVISSSISKDSDSETLGSASINVTQSVGECYIRIYLIIIQNGVKEKIPLGTYLVQTPSSNFDGKIRSVTMDAYTPLLELKENPPPIGYYIPKNTNVMNMAYKLASENMRAPVVATTCATNVFYDFIADASDTWLSYLKDLALYAKYTFMVDEMGRILFSPVQDTASLQPVWTYTDDNSSILYPDLNMDHDLYGIPNVVEVLYSNNGQYFYSKITNNDSNSPTSVINRGRTITHRDTNPSLDGLPTQHRIDEYAKKLLKELSTLEYTVSYTHAYCPVRVGDCICLNYEKAGLKNVKAKVISQNIRCEAGCSVSEKAVFTTKLWE